MIDITLKKRIIGFLLLIGIILIIIPLFFGRSIPADELKLSGHIPQAPTKPADISVPIPPQAASTPAPVAVQPAKPAIIAKPATPIISEQSKPSPVTTVKNDTTHNGHTATTTSLPITNPTSTAHKVTPKTTPPAATAKPASIVEATPPVPMPSHTVPTKQPKPASTGTEVWSIQLGSFSEKLNVEKLTKKLQAQNFSVYTRTIKTAKGNNSKENNLVKVLVGPMTHNDAEQAKARIQKELGIQGVLVKQ